MKFAIRFEGYPAVEVEEGTSLLEACDDHKIPMESACGGFAACNSCRVRLVEGSLSPILEEELAFLESPGQRLGCQARVCGPAVLALEPGI